MYQEEIQEDSSDCLNIQVKPSQIPNSGQGVFAKNFIKKGDYIAEYRGNIIESKYGWGHPFTWEDKMIFINSRYCLLGRNIAARINDIINFDLYNLRQALSKEHYILQSFSENDKHDIEGFSHNVRSIGIHDKIFLVASRDIQQNEELFFDYSYSYWKFFYDQFIKHPQSFFEYWEKEKQYAYNLYDKFIISDSEILKLLEKDGKIISSREILVGEYILELRGQIKKIDEQSKNSCLKLREDIKLCLNQFSEKMIKQVSRYYYIYFNGQKIKIEIEIIQRSQNDINSEIKRFGDKYFIVSNLFIQPGQEILIFKQDLMNYIIQ